MYYYDQLRFTKKGNKIIEKAEIKADHLKKKVQERKRIVSEIAGKLGIDTVSGALLQIDDLRSELDAEQNIQHSKLLSNRNKAQTEQTELKQLQMIIRNLNPKAEFELEFAALEYFGF